MTGMNTTGSSGNKQLSAQDQAHNCICQNYDDFWTLKQTIEKSSDLFKEN